MPDTSEIANGAAVVASGYLKRWLEGAFYDRIGETNAFRSLQQLGAAEKYTVEAGLNLLAAFFDHHMANDSALKRLIKDVGLDAAPEISKRLINHASSLRKDSIASLLLSLPKQDLVALIDWLYSSSPNDRSMVISILSAQSPENLAKLVSLSADERRKLLLALAGQSLPPQSGGLARGIRHFRRKVFGG